VKIALDATPLTVPTGGVRRYTWELAKSLASLFPSDEFWLLSDQRIADCGPRPDNLQTGDGPRLPVERKWWLWGLRREMARHNVELFHGTDFSVPYSSHVPSVMTLHDLSPWINRSWQPDASRIRRRTQVLLRLGIPTIVITPSEAVRREAIRYFHLDENRIIAIPLAASASFRPVRGHEWPRPYFLFVGTLEPRKNIKGLMEAWREVRKHRDVDLVLAGRIRSDFEAPIPEPGLHVLGPVSEADLPGWYCGALAVVYPSLYEGFGLPVLEAMQCGAVVITSRDPAIMEVSAGASINVDAEDTRALSEAMDAVVCRSTRIADVRVSAIARAADFNWEKTAQRTRAVYDTAIARFARRGV
jgi:glycosyltransferase involved in cell wall biosynthesis